jgi:hypothetical protein
LLTGTASHVDETAHGIRASRVNLLGERPMTLLSLIKLMHLAGLIMGFGGAILADVLILRGAILRPIDQKTIQSVKSLSHIVFFGLAVLWLSGIILVGIRVSADPNVWMNQKIWAKVIIVCILTINGILVHNIALGRLAARQSQKLFSISRPYELVGLSLVAAVSSVSWFVPFVLGVATEFNFTVKAVGILAVYMLLTMLGWAAFLTIAYLSAEKATVRKSTARNSYLKTTNVHDLSQYQMARGLVATKIHSELDYFKQQMKDHEARWTSFRNDIQKSVANLDESLDDLKVFDNSRLTEIGIAEPKYAQRKSPFVGQHTDDFKSGYAESNQISFRALARA